MSNSPKQRDENWEEKLDRNSLPEKGGLYWLMGGVPAKKLPLPCEECITFLSQLTESEVQRLVELAKAEASLPANR